MTTNDALAAVRAEAKAAATAHAWTEEPNAEVELARLRKVCDEHIARLRDVNTWAEFNEAAKAVIAAIQPTPPRRIVHRIDSGMGITGADLDLDSVLRDLDDAVSIDWVNGLAGHDLRYQDPAGKRWLLAVTRPQPADTPEGDQ